MFLLLILPIKSQLPVEMMKFVGFVEFVVAGLVQQPIQLPDPDIEQCSTSAVGTEETSSRFPKQPFKEPFLYSYAVVC